jgi:hypothetical protein
MTGNGNLERLVRARVVKTSGFLVALSGSRQALAYLTAALTAIVNGHRQSRVEELLPWHYAIKQKQARTALGLCVQVRS